MTQPSLKDRFNGWLGLMSTVKLSVRKLGTGVATGQTPTPEYLGNLERALQVLDTEFAALFGEQGAALDRAVEKLEEAARLLDATADRMEAEPFFPQAVYQPETERGYLQDMATPAAPSNVVHFPGVRRSRQGEGGAA